MKTENICLQYMNYKKLKCLFAMHELWKFCLQYMNDENIKMFVCNTRIMKKWKYLLSIYEL